MILTIFYWEYNNGIKNIIHFFYVLQVVTRNTFIFIFNLSSKYNLVKWRYANGAVVCGDSTDKD